MIRDHFHVSVAGLGRVNPRVVELSVQAGPPLAGVRLLFVADVHLSRHFNERCVLELLERIRALSPDIVLWGGDYAETRAHLERFFEMASALQPPLGMFAAVGNNDMESAGAAQITDWAGAAGIKLLINRQFRLAVSDGSLLILGLDEPKHGRPDLSLLRMPAQPGEYRVLLMHSPLPLAEMPDNLSTPPQLILCGHTHGGQLSLFGFNPYSIGYEHARGRKNFYVTGTHQLGPSLLVVSNGVGAAAPPIRIGAPPQLHLVKFSK